ncbi:Short-chain-enoyl-CoA hydratase [Rhodococcus sp. B50]|nr:Short-chain-enoyl-CoA hydratase [Rhodococcus sp. B50]
MSAGIAHVRLNRPDKLNALDAPMFEALVSTGLQLTDRSDVSAVVLSGAGRAFCAGLDLTQFEHMQDGTSDVVVLGERLGAARALAQKAVHVWSMVPVPVIAAVHGVAFGGGLQIALGVDIRIVSPDARLSVMEIRWGLTPDMAGTQLLPELVGRDVAKELTFTGRIVEGADAVSLGLATREAAEPVTVALELAREIAGHSRTALVHAKHLLDLAGRVPLAEGLDAEQQAVAELIGSDEQRAAIRRCRG